MKEQNDIQLPLTLQGFKFTLLGVEVRSETPIYNILIMNGQFEATARIGKCPGDGPAIYNVQIRSTHGMTCLMEYMEELYIVYKNFSSDIYKHFKDQDYAHRTSKTTTP